MLFRSNWAARARFCSPGRSREWFRSPKRLVFDRFRHARALPADCVPGQQNIVKNWYTEHIRAFARQDKSDEKSI